MDFRRIHLSLFRELTSRIIWKVVLKSGGAHALEGRSVCCLSRKISSKDKNNPSQSMRKWAGITGDQTGRLGNSWLRSNAERKCTGGRNRGGLTKKEY